MIMSLWTRELSCRAAGCLSVSSLVSQKIKFVTRSVIAWVENVDFIPEQLLRPSKREREWLLSTLQVRICRTVDDSTSRAVNA